MNTALVILVSLLAAGFALGFYMDWFGLWVSKAELQKEIERVEQRRISEADRRHHSFHS